jgi:hypothetical protein
MGLVERFAHTLESSAGLGQWRLNGGGPPTRRQGGIRAPDDHDAILMIRSPDRFADARADASNTILPTFGICRGPWA